MEIEVELVPAPIESGGSAARAKSSSGAALEFRGIVRDEEDGQKIKALRYEAYGSMAKRQIEKILAEEGAPHPCEHVTIIHRHGWIPVGETAILVRIESRHRAEAIALLAKFMDRLKRDVPIWKVESAPR